MKENNLEAIYIPKRLFDQASARLSERELDLDDYICLTLRLMLKNKTVLRLADQMPFGKYAGETVETVCRADPAYVIWLINEKGKTRFDPEVHKLVDQFAEKEASA